MKLLIALSVLVAGVLAKTGDLSLTNDCAAEVAKYKECFEGVNAENIETKEQADQFCANFNDQPKCKTFLEDISKTTSSCFSEDNEVYRDDAVALQSILEHRLEYLLLCSRKKDGSLCPISQMYSENMTALMETEQEKITDEQMKVITEDCKISECNERMVTIFTDYNLLIKMMSIVYDNFYENDNEPYFLSQLLYGYENFFGNKKCSTTDIVHDPYENVNANCEAELSQYTECINEMDEIYQAEITTEEHVKDFCSIFQKPVCKQLLADINKVDSACIIRANLLSQNLENAEMVLTTKLNYHLFCSTDKSGNLCPVTKYTTSNFEAINQIQDEITTEQDEIITQDCKIEECNDRMVTLFNLYDELLNIQSYQYGVTFSYENNPDFLSQLLFSYQEFYKNKQCDPNDIFHEEEFDYCEYEVQLYQECVDEVKDMKLNSEKNINAYCDKINTSAKCIDFLYGLSDTYLGCFSVDEPNKSDYYAGLNYFQQKLNYHLYCSKDNDGQRCPLSSYIVSNLEEANDKTQNDFNQNQLLAIKTDCANNRCNDQRNTLFTLYRDFKTITAEILGDDFSEDVFFVTQFLNHYDNYYRNKECVPTVAESLEGTRSSECETEYAKYSKCINDFRMIDVDSYGAINYLCSFMDKSKCKSFLKDVSLAESSCINAAKTSTKTDATTSSTIDEDTGLVILNLRLQYQTYCSTDNYGDICPLSFYIMDTISTVYYGDEDGDQKIDDFTTIGINEIKFDDLRKIGNECREDQCNARILSLKELSDYITKNELDLESPLIKSEFMSTYYTHFKEKTCNVIDDYNPDEENNYGAGDESPINIDIDFGSPSPECQEEYNRYSECLNQLTGLQLESGEDFKTMCDILSNDQCDTFRNELNDPTTKCIDISDPANMNIMNYFYGVSILSYKMQYLMYCAKDAKGGICPLSQYLLENHEEENLEGTDEGIDIKQIEKEEDVISPEQLKTIAADCRDVSCNARMMSIGKYYEYLQQIMGADKVEKEDTVQKFIDNYNDGNCSAIDQSDPSLDKDILNNKTNSKGNDDTTTNDTISDENKNASGEDSQQSSDATTFKKMTMTMLMMVMVSSLFLL